MTPPSLLIAALVLRLHPVVGDLSHVADTVSSFLVPASSLSLAKACRFGSLKLLDHIWAASCTSIADRTPWWSLANYLRSDRHYHAWAFSEALKGAAGRGDLKVVTWLFAHFPGCTADVGVVEAAAEAGHLHILQFVHGNSTAASYIYARGDRQNETSDTVGLGSAITVYWGRSDLKFAAQNDHLETARWLYEHTRSTNEHRDMGYALSTALRFGDASFVELILAPVPLNDANAIAQAVVQLAISGHLELILPLRERLVSIQAGSSYWKRALEAACYHGHLNAVKLLLEQWPGKRDCSLSTRIQALRDASQRGHLEVVQYFAQKASTQVLVGALCFAAYKSHLRVVQWLQSEILERLAQRRPCRVQSTRDQGKDDMSVMPWTCPEKLGLWMDMAAGNGHLEMLQFLQELSRALNPRVPKKLRDEETLDDREIESGKCARKTSSTDVTTGRLRSRRHVTPIVSDRCRVAESTADAPPMLATSLAMDKAAANGHLDVAQWLRANGLNSCTSAAMDNTAAAGHLEMVQWLHANMQAECTSAAMDEAATNGHLEIVQWLHANRSEGCTTKAMDGAASSGHLKVVQWLHANRLESCTSNAVEKAVANGHVRVVRWLFAHFPAAVPTPRAMTQRCNFDMILFLHSHCPEAFSNDAVEILRVSCTQQCDRMVGRAVPGD